MNAIAAATRRAKTPQAVEGVAWQSGGGTPHRPNTSSDKPRQVFGSRDGHRTYLDNPKLISTQVHREPVAKGHRQWMGKQEWK